MKYQCLHCKHSFPTHPRKILGSNLTLLLGKGDRERDVREWEGAKHSWKKAHLGRSHPVQQSLCSLHGLGGRMRALSFPL